jgi:transposase InsO family protein
LDIAPGSPWEYGYCESFNGKLRDGLMNGESFLQPERSKDRQRAMAEAGQHHSTALFTRIPNTCAPQTMNVYPNTKSSRANAIISSSRRYKNPVRPPLLEHIETKEAAN